jgi:hypothetical protein
MGYNDFTALRQSLADIEETKLKIDEELITLKSDVANIKILKRRKSKLQKKKSKLTSDLALEKQKLVTANEELSKLQSQAENYDISNNVEIIRSELRALVASQVDDRQRYLRKVDKLKSKLSMFFTVFFTVSFVVMFLGLWLWSVYVLSNGFGDFSEGGAAATIGAVLVVLPAIMLGYIGFMKGLDMSDSIFERYSENIIGWMGHNPEHRQAVQLDLAASAVFYESERLHNKCKKAQEHCAEKKKSMQWPETELKEIKQIERKNIKSGRTIEQEIKDLVTQIPQQINDIRNNSTRIEQIFDGVKHLIPNSETVSLNSSNLDEILDAINIEIN